MISWLKKLAKPKSSDSAAGPAARSPHVEIPHEKIVQRAYEIWVRKGHPHGQDDQNWREAEAELRAEFAHGGSEPLPNRPR